MSFPLQGWVAGACLYLLSFLGLLCLLHLKDRRVAARLLLVMVSLLLTHGVSVSSLMLISPDQLSERLAVVHWAVLGLVALLFLTIVRRIWRIQHFTL